MANELNPAKSFFTAQVADLIPGKALGCDIHLFFTKNQHMIILKHRGDVLSSTLLERWAEQGVRQVWVHLDDREAYEAYLKEAQDHESEAAPQAEPTPPTPPTPQANTTPSNHPEIDPTDSDAALTLIELFKARQMEDKKKIVLIAKCAREMIKRTMNAKDPVSLSQAHKQAQNNVKELIETIPTTSQATVLELWKINDLGLELHHATHVATYSVLTSLAFGKIDPELLADLALAGLLHDVGLCQIPLQISLKPWNQMTPEMLVIHGKHIASGIEIINAFGPDIPQRVKNWIQQHHEKFDGSGYPEKLSGPKIAIPAQLLGLAELIDSIATGQWDGKTRTYREALHTIQALDRTQGRPQYLNPEVLSAIFRWIGP